MTNLKIKLKLGAIYHLTNLILFILSLSTMILLAFFVYRYTHEVRLITASLVELRPEIAITEPLNLSKWLRLKENIKQKRSGQLLDTINLRNPFVLP